MIWTVLLWALRAFAMLRPKRVIYVDGVLYLTRWYLTPVSRDARGVYRKRAWWPFREYYLHCFRASDPDRGWHTHPWVDGRSRILEGVYAESQMSPPFRSGGSYRNWWTLYAAGCVNRIPHAHRIILVTPVVWTLFSHGERHGRGWGFYDHRGLFTPAREVE
jgi:hypothetical protein